MRPVNWDDCIKALISIVDRPNMEKGYQDLKKYYLSNSMKDEGYAIDFLLKQKFNANSSDTNQE